MKSTQKVPVESTGHTCGTDKSKFYVKDKTVVHIEVNEVRNT